MTSDICYNCGYPEGLHHYETMQCPKGGESQIGKKQEWLGTVFVPRPKDDKQDLEKRIRKLEKKLIQLEKDFIALSVELI